MSSPTLTPVPQSQSLYYPVCGEKELKARFVGQLLWSAPTPAAVIDAAKTRAHCESMLTTLAALDVSFRAHVKTHKTTELTRLQVGEGVGVGLESPSSVRLIVSTVAELEHLLPLLQSYQARTPAPEINVLYGLPFPASQLARLAAVASSLGPGSLTLMIDHPAQLLHLHSFKTLTSFPPHVFIKVDAGTHRAGLTPGSQTMRHLVEEVCASESAGNCLLNGFYAHAGHSYGGNSPDDAMATLRHEVEVCLEAAALASETDAGKGVKRRIVISVGASPTAVSVQNLRSQSGERSSTAKSLQETLQLNKEHFELEIHAGVYPLLDVQQIATHARAFEGDPYDAIALTVLAEVCSLYPEREQPEALIAAGSLALGREPCKGYAGWGVVTPWGFDNKELVDDNSSRLIVRRISQEHGILGFENDPLTKPIPVKVGQKIRIWPNHACIASAGYDWYLIVDSSSADPNRITDVWVRCRGW